MSFYVTLPSNASMNIFPDNNPSKFFIKLPQTIELSSQYEVGLAEIQFPNSYFNVLEDTTWLHYLPTFEAPDKTPPVGDTVAVETWPSVGTNSIINMPAGLYESAETFVDALNQLITNTFGTSPPVKIHYNRASKKAVIKLYKKGAQVYLSDGLKEILALPSSLLNDENRELRGQDMVDLDRDMKNVYVYCDLVSPRPVGDVSVPLLRCVPLLDRTISSVFRIYDKPHYINLSRFAFDTIEILLTTDQGKTIPFTAGTSVVTLHFRTRKQFALE